MKTCRCFAIFVLVLFLIGCSTKARTPLDSHFGSSPEIVPFYDEYWMLQEALVFHMERIHRSERYPATPMEAIITVPAGFVTDLASIPPPANVVFSKTGRYSSAGIVHDYLYWVQPCGDDERSREIADRIIKEALKGADRRDKLGRLALDYIDVWDDGDNKPSYEEAIDHFRKTELKLIRDTGQGLAHPDGWFYSLRRKAARNSIKHTLYYFGGGAWTKNQDKRKSESRFVPKEHRDRIAPGDKWTNVKGLLSERLPDINAGSLGGERGLLVSEKPSYCHIFAPDEW